MKPILTEESWQLRVGRRQTPEIQKCFILACPFHPVVTDFVFFYPMILPEQKRWCHGKESRVDSKETTKFALKGRQENRTSDAGPALVKICAPLPC